MSLSLKQRKFVEAYTGVARGNASEAARRAGYRCGTPGSAASQGKRLLDNPAIAEAIREHDGIPERSGEPDPAIAGGDDVQVFLSQVMRGEVDDSKVSDQVRAADHLAKMKGLYVSRQTGEVSATEAALLLLASRYRAEGDRPTSSTGAASSAPSPKADDGRTRDE